MVIVFANLIGVFTDFYRQGSATTGAQFSRSVNQCVFYIIYLFIARLVASYIMNLGFRVSSLRISSSIRVIYLRSLFALPISTLDAIPAGQTAAIVTVTAGLLQVGISERLGGGVAGAASVASAVVVALVFNWLLTLVTLAGLVFIGIAYAVFTPLVGRQALAVHEADIKAASVAAEAFASYRMLAACGAEAKAIRKTFALAFWFAFRMHAVVLITTPEDLIVVLLCVMMMATSIGQISAPLAAAHQAAEACAIFHTIIDAPKPTYGAAKGDGEVRADGDIVLMNVNFAYPARPEVRVLDQLNLTFPAGKVTAIVGPSGSGKSTIVGILERWYEFNGDPATNPIVLFLRNGFVTVGGRLLTEIDIKWWRNQIGLVQQDNVLFNTTIYKNVENGLIGTRWEHESDEKKALLIEAACKDAFADEFIARLPDGYQTTVGESGIKLSGGQRQRLAIARAIVKQPKILILDEATSAIDVRSEQIVQAALERASVGRTTIVIAHRLGTIKRADKIVVLRKGRVVQQGTHDELRAQRGSAYSMLATAQTIDVGPAGNPPPPLPAGLFAAAALDGEEEEEEEEEVVVGRGGDGSSHFLSVPEGGSGSSGRGRRDSWHTCTTVSSAAPPERLVARDDIGEEAAAPMMSATSTRVSTQITIPGSDGSSDVSSDDDGRIKLVEEESHWLGGFAELLAEQGSKWKLYAAIFVGALGAGASTPVQAYLFAMLLNLFSFWGQSVQRAANFFCLMFVALAGGVALSHLLLGWSTTRLGFSLTRLYRKEYFSNIITKPAAFFDEEEHTIGALTARLATDPTQLQQLLGANMAFVLVSLFNVVGCCIVGFVFGWKLTAVALASTMPVIVAAMFYRVRHEVRLEMEANRVFAEGARYASESIAAIRTVSSLTMEQGVGERYEKLLADHHFLPVHCICAVVWRALVGQPRVHPVPICAGVHCRRPRCHECRPVAQLQSQALDIAHATAAADRVLDMRDMDYDDGRVGVPGLGPHAFAGSEDEKTGVEVEFRGVWFSYPTRSGPVLRGLSIKVARGQFAAIVGPSGSGKTTVISLLERFYSANGAGQVLCNGHDVLDLDLARYREAMSLVAQEPCLLNGSVRDNILLGIADESAVVEADVHAAAKEAGLHDFVISLPQGYDTEVGAAGVALSGGQKQRLSIARALVRRPSLLLLDEATSSLDSETEAAVQQTFEAAKGSRTMIVVAHRLATVRNADVIFVMSEGRVVERGTHATLISRRGIYYEMCQSQALDR
ncbi:hypothetical protein RB600_010300 [Gaeumannomyces tritici]